jgi:hypothetical protein
MRIYPGADTQVTDSGIYPDAAAQVTDSGATMLNNYPLQTAKVFMNQKWFSSAVLSLGLTLGHHAWAQSPWPAVQAESYPMVSSMKLVRHEQSILLGEADQQTGLFFAHLGQTHSAQVQSQLITDAQRKGWKLETVMRYGTQFVLTFSKGPRLLEIRLTTRADGVEAVYSVVLNQQAPAAP